MALVALGLCFALNMASRGFGETFAVFYASLLEELGNDRARVASIFSVYMLSLGLSGPLVGAIYDRFGPRLVYAIGLACFALGFHVASDMTRIWEGWLSLGLLCGLGTTFIGLIPATGIVSRWFSQRLMLANGIVYAGLPVGNMVLAPFSGYLISTSGWRSAYDTFALMLAVLSAVMLILPWSKLTAPGGTSLAPRRRIMHLPAASLRTSAFWGLFNIFGLTAMAIYLIQVQSVLYLMDAGYPPLQATFLFGFTSFLSIAGMIGGGWLADRWGTRPVAFTTYSMSIIGIVALMILDRGPDPVFLCLFLFFFGTTMGSRGPVVSSLASQLFPGHIGAVMGLLTISYGVGAGMGSWLSGVLFEWTKGYQTGLIVSICILGLSMLHFWFIPALASRPASERSSL